MADPRTFPPDTFGRPIPEGVAPGPGYGSGRINRPPASFADQLRDWVDVLARGRWLILAAVLLVAIPVTAYALLAPNVYEASAYLYVETESGGALSGLLEGGDGAFGQDRGISNELYILQKAEDLADAVAVDLLGQPDATRGQLTVLQTESGVTDDADLVADRVSGRYLRVSQDGDQANGVRVSATSESPVEAALIANLYAEAYVERTRSSSRASVTASRTFLESQVDSAAIALAEREDDTRAYMDREGAVRLDEEASTLVSQLSSLEAARDQARVELGMQSSRADELRSQVARLERNLAGRMGSGTGRALQQDETRLAGLRERLETIYLRDPSLRDRAEVPTDVAELRRQVAALEARVRQRSDRLVDEAIAAGGVDAASEGLPRLSALRDRLTETEVAIRGLRSQIRILDGRVATYEAQLDEIPGQSIELARLIRERESTERLALGLDQRLQEARVAESAELGYAEVIRSADPPGRPVAPNRTRMIVLGLLIGLGLGVVLAVGRSQLDQAVRRPGQLRDLGFPVLGVIPDMADLIEEGEGAPSVEVGGRPVDAHLVTLLSPLSASAEAFRGLRTSVQFARPDAVVHTILVTSAVPGEGKSTVAANLAVVMAQAGRRTLLLDADLRRPQIHKVFGLTKAPGLTERLSGQADGGEQNVADDFDVLTAGEGVANPAEYLASQAFRDLLDRFRAEYDVIVVDAPPVMAVTDPVLLSTQVDGVVLVASSGRTKDFELQYAAQELETVGGSVLGAVLNRFDLSREYGYRYQYAYKYDSTYTYGSDTA